MVKACPVPMDDLPPRSREYPRETQTVKWPLDADVLSQPAKRAGDARVIAWLEAQEPHCYTSAVVIGQLAYWIRTKKGAQRAAL